MEEDIFLFHRRILILGPVDSGKSYLFRRIIELWKRRGYRFTALDTDVGQSTLGLPTTITLMERGNTTFFFYGFTTPRAHPPRFLAGVSRMNRAGRIVVDTTGYIEYPGGLELKRAKIEMLNPDLIVAFPSTDPGWKEFLDSLPFKVIRMKREPAVKKRSSREREIYRNKKLREYFSETQEFEVKKNSLFPVKLGTRPMAGALVSLRQGNTDISLGYIKSLQGERVKIMVPRGKNHPGYILFSTYLYEGFPSQPSLF